MTTATTHINITAKDSTAAAFASANSNLSGLASAALKTTTALSAIGAGAFVGSMAAFTKQTIDAQDELFKLSQKTGIAVESLAGLEFAAEQSGVELEKVAKATRAFTLLVAESSDASSESAKKLQQLGLSYQDLKDKSPEKQLLALADALSKFSKEDRPVALVSTLGQKMADLIPLLSGGSQGLQQLIDQGKKLNPVTEESARNAEKFNDQINLLNKSVSALGREMVQDLIPSLTRISDEMVKAAEKGGILAGALAGVKQLFTESFGSPKILGDVGQIRREIIKTQETISSLSGKKDSIFFDKNALAHEQEKLVQLEIDLKKAIDASREVFAAQDANTVATKKFAVALDEVNKPLSNRAVKIDSLTKKMNDQSRIESDYVKLLVIERKAREDLLRPYQQSAKSAEERLDSMRQESAALELSKTKQISLEHAIELTTIARLEEKKVITKDSVAVAAIDQEIAARKEIIGVIQSTESKTKQLVQATQSASDQVSQLWMQAGRNIQSTLANSIFNFFDDGLKGMVKNVTSAVGRIASEFASLRIAQAIGLSSMFGVSGTASAGGIGSTGSGFLDVASLGLNASSLFKSGFGATNLIGGLGSNLPGTAGSFFSGFGVGGTEAAAQAGASALWGASGASTAASMGTSFAAAAGPLIALAAVDAIGRVFGGDKKLGGAEMIPVIGGFLAGLFGHGPMKFRQQSLQGTASSDGFDGDITNVFRAKGGLFVGNKHKSVSEQLSLEQQTLFDTALSGFYGSAHNFAENLGLSTDLVDNFTAQVQIKSEKGKTLTEEAITGMLKGIGNSLAQNVLPMVDTLRKAGEDSFATMTRLNNEFVALTQGAENLGASVGYAKEIIRGMTFEARTAFVDAAGGIDSLTTKTQFFADNFLTAAERLAPASQRLAESMQALGLSSDITKEQFKALVQSYGQLNGITENQLQGLLNLAPAFVAIKNAQEQLIGTTNKVAESERSLNDVRQELLSSYNKERGELESTISKFKSVSDSLKSFRDSLSLGQLSPLTPGQKLEEARAQFNRTRIAAAQGDQSALENLSGVSQEFLQASQNYNASSAAFISDFNLVKGVLDNASQSALSQSEIARNQLTALDKSVDYLVDIQTNTKTTADLIREINIKSLTGSGNAAISTKDIQGFLSANPNLTAQQIANAATKYGVSGQQLIDAGVDRGAVDLFIKGSSITDKQILDFVNSGASPQQIYDAAVANGVSSARLSAATGISKADIDKFVKDNRLPSFAKGTDFVAKTGLAMVHRAEAIVPSSTTDSINKLIQLMKEFKEEQNQQTGDLIKVTDITSKQNADTIAEAITVIDKNRQWNSRAMVRLA